MRSEFRGRLNRVASLILVATMAAVLAGCGLVELFYPDPYGLSSYPLFDPSDYPDGSFPFDESFGVPTQYHHGTATIQITSGEPMTVVLPHLAGDSPSVFEPGFGPAVSWRGGDWSMRLLSADVPTLIQSNMLTFAREDTDPPLTADGSKCTVKVSSMTSTRFAGTATCKGLVWTDVYDMGYDPDLPSPTPAPRSSHVGLPPFDATITFEATP